MALRQAFRRVGAMKALGAAVAQEVAGSAQTALPALYVSGFTTTAARAHHCNAVEYELYDRSRQEIPLGSMYPSIACDAFIAPNATVAGDTDIADQATVWHGAVLRGDLNTIRVGPYSSISEKCVVHAGSAPTRIGQFVTVGAGSTISSAIVEDNVAIGEKCVLSEGSYVESDSALEAGSVVQEGQLIPSGQLWGGNPAEYVRDLTSDELAAIPKMATRIYATASEHADQMLPFGMAYLEAEKLREVLANK